MDSSSNPNNNINIIESSNDNLNAINSLEYSEKNLQKIISIEEIIQFISSNILSIVDKNKKNKKKQSKGVNEPLYSRKIPNLSLEKFLVRIVKYTEAENNTLIVAYLYIIKLNTKYLNYKIILEKNFIIWYNIAVISIKEGEIWHLLIVLIVVNKYQSMQSNVFIVAIRLI